MAAHLDARGRLGRAKDDGDRTAPVGIVDVDRQKAALVVMGVKQRKLLVAVDDVAGIVDVECHRARWLRVGVDPGLDERVGQANHVAQARRVLEPRQGRLRAKASPLSGRRPQASLNAGSRRRWSRSSASS